MTRNEHTAEEDAGLVARFNAPFFQRGIRRSKDNTTAGRNLQTANFQLSQQAQNAALIGTLRPYPQPAYLTNSPYQSIAANVAGACGCAYNAG